MKIVKGVCFVSFKSVRGVFDILTQMYNTRIMSSCFADEVRNMFTRAGLTEVQNLVDRRLQVNRLRQIKMHRVWIQSKFMKPHVTAASSSDSVHPS